MKVALFIPCYIDVIYPKVGVATLELLERLGVQVEVPLNQTCCGQPMSNEGDQKTAAGSQELFCKNFAGYDYIVGPAGSCVKQVRMHMDAIPQTATVQHVRKNTYELVEFLTDILKVSQFPWANFNHRVAIHNSCSSIRGLHLASRSEWIEPYFNKTEALLQKVTGIQIEHIDRPDECCGFGGTFCVADEPVSARMGQDKVADYLRHNVEFVISPDMSCLMHQSGIAEKQQRPLNFLHVAQVLNNGPF
jgi:L-lactate dehydrogenase complex protein LldE